MTVLLTKKLSASDLDLIRSWGWNFEVAEPLNITQVDVNEIPIAEAWVVSSRNSLHVIQKFISQSPELIFSVGNWMKEELLKTGIKSEIRSFENMRKLTRGVAERNLKSILYFCGQEHRQELEDGLKGCSTKISKVITHKSQMTYPILKNTFDIVFVFSPRAAESLLKNNSFRSQTVFACIGPTTASYLNSHDITNTFISSYPDSRILLEEFHSQIQNREPRIQNPIP